MELSDRFTEALVLATRLHAHQFRKGSDIPYISHLLAVSSLVLEYGGNEDEAIAALLHDAVEDQGGDATRQLIRQHFGETVTSIVDGCSDTDVLPKPPWLERKTAYITHLLTAPSAVLLVSAADKLHNVRAILGDYRVIGEAVWLRFSGGKTGTLWYYRSLIDVYKKRDDTPLIAELERTFQVLETLVLPAPSSLP